MDGIVELEAVLCSSSPALHSSCHKKSFKNVIHLAVKTSSRAGSGADCEYGEPWIDSGQLLTPGLPKSSSRKNVKNLQRRMNGLFIDISKNYP